jgi:hypothetical protein
MSRISQRAGKKRFAIIIGLAGTVAVAWFMLSGPGVEQIGEEIVSAEVLEIIQRSSANGPKPRKGGLGIAVVELPDGGRARVFVPRSKASIGAEITVKVKRYSDGSRHVTGGDGKLPGAAQNDP